MNSLEILTLQEIRKRLSNSDLPFSGITPLGSAEFHFIQQACYAGVALHAGGLVRPSLEDFMNASQEERFREEDPYMDRFIKNFPIQVIARDSRFEYDLNRKVAQTIYDHDKRTWGIRVWENELSQEERNFSLSKYHEFHDLVDIMTEYLLGLNKYSVIFDMHSYCYQRENRVSWYNESNPEINVGTGAANRDLFLPLIERFIASLSGSKIDNHTIRVAENEILSGGYLAQRLSLVHFDRLFVPALEYKKIFMDEHTGELYDEVLQILIHDFKKAVKKLSGLKFFKGL